MTSKKKTKRAKKHVKRAPARRRMKQQEMFPRVGENGARATSPLMVRFTPQQYAFVRHAAALRGVNAAAFIRVATLDLLQSELEKKTPAELKSWVHDAERAASFREKEVNHE